MKLVSVGHNKIDIRSVSPPIYFPERRKEHWGNVPHRLMHSEYELDQPDEYITVTRQKMGNEIHQSSWRWILLDWSHDRFHSLNGHWLSWNVCGLVFNGQFMQAPILCFLLSMRNLVRTLQSKYLLVRDSTVSKICRWKVFSHVVENHPVCWWK